MIKCGPETRLYLSLAARPGRFGATIYNELFRRRGINAVYLPKTAPLQAEGVVSSLKILGISGCSVSMPLKSKVIPYLDELDELVSKTGSCNTILIRGETAAGYNTDVYGCEKVLAKIAPVERAVIYGYGSVVASVVLALRQSGVSSICITGRNPAKARKRSEELNCAFAGPTQYQASGLFINATPASADREATASELIPHAERADAVFDLPVARSGTHLEVWSNQAGKRFIPGKEMGFGQLQQQFFHYFGQQIELDEIRQIHESGINGEN